MDLGKLETNPNPSEAVLMDLEVQQDLKAEQEKAATFKMEKDLFQNDVDLEAPEEMDPETFKINQELDLYLHGSKSQDFFLAILKIIGSDESKINGLKKVIGVDPKIIFHWKKVLEDKGLLPTPPTFNRAQTPTPYRKRNRSIAWEEELEERIDRMLDGRESPIGDAVQFDQEVIRNRRAHALQRQHPPTIDPTISALFAPYVQPTPPPKVDPMKKYLEEPHFWPRVEQQRCVSVEEAAEEFRQLAIEKRAEMRAALLEPEPAPQPEDLVADWNAYLNEVKLGMAQRLQRMSQHGVQAPIRQHHNGEGPNPVIAALRAGGMDVGNVQQRESPFGANPIEAVVAAMRARGVYPEAGEDPGPHQRRRLGQNRLEIYRTWRNRDPEAREAPGPAPPARHHQNAFGRIPDPIEADLAPEDGIFRPWRNRDPEHGPGPAPPARPPQERERHHQNEFGQNPNPIEALHDPASFDRFLNPDEAMDEEEEEGEEDLPLQNPDGTISHEAVLAAMRADEARELEALRNAPGPSFRLPAPPATLPRNGPFGPNPIETVLAAMRADEALQDPENGPGPSLSLSERRAARHRQNRAREEAQDPGNGSENEPEDEEEDRPEDPDRAISLEDVLRMRR